MEDEATLSSVVAVAVVVVIVVVVVAVVNVIDRLHLHKTWFSSFEKKKQDRRTDQPTL